MIATMFGWALIVASIYFLGQNIIFTSYYSPSWSRQLPAVGAVLSILLGIGSLTFWRQQIGNFGWIFIAIGIILVFLSGGVILQGTSLWTFFVSMLLFASGYQLLTRGRIRF
jgi:hypothetical protein